MFPLRKLVKDNLTDYNGRTYDTGRSIAWFIIMAMTGMQVYALIQGQAFDPMAFAGGCAAVLACLGVAIAGDNIKRPDAPSSVVTTSTTSTVST